MVKLKSGMPGFGFVSLLTLLMILLWDLPDSLSHYLFIGGIVLSAIGIGENTENTENIVKGIAGILGSVTGLIVVVAILGWLYFALMESSKTQATLGKMALGLKVTDLEGNRISFGRATGRYFGKIISGMIIYIGYILAGLTEKKQALHDIMASCLVVRKNEAVS